MTSEVEDEIRLLSGGVSEPLVIQELLERLRELEAENSALAQANETQRETYERCLDEVANHVVQALLNQKDLREECIKLKKRVFDLERQNRALSDLFHQKLQRSSGSSPELHPLQGVSDSQGGDLERLSASLPQGQCAVQREEKHRSARAQSSCRSLDAMSPFLRKKAQILEVLRRLEGTGSPSGSSCTTPSHTAVYLGSLPSASGNGLCIRSDQGLDYLNGEGMSPPDHGVDEPWASCLLLAQSGWEELLKWKSIQREPPAGSPGEGGGEHLGLAVAEETPQSMRQAEGSSSSSDDDIGEPPPPPSEIRRLPLTDLAKGLSPCMCSRGAGDKRGPVEGHSDGTGFSRGHIGHLHSMTCYSRSYHDMVESQHMPGTSPAVTEKGDSLSCSPGKQLASDHAPDRPSSPCPAPSGSLSLPRDMIGLNHTSATQEPLEDCSQPKAVAPDISSSDPQDALISSTEPRTPHLPSPAKFLKFLKLPGSAEKSQSPNSLRLSPQLTQTSKIPCRSNNYEAFPSPRPSRKAAEETPVPEVDADPPSPSDLMHSDASRQGQSERSNSLVNRSGIQCYTKKSHDYENIPAKNAEISTPNQSVQELDDSPKMVISVCSFGCSPGLCVHSQVHCTDDHHGQIALNRKLVTSRKPIESSAHLPFKERIGKLRGSENQQTELNTTVTENGRVLTDGSDLRPSMKRSLAVTSLRTPPEPGSTESYPPRYHSQKSDVARTRQPATSCPPGSPHGPRNQHRAPPVPSKSPRSPHGSPTKLPAKSPSKATAKPLASRPLSEELRPSPRQATTSNEDKQRLQSASVGKKAGTSPEYACPRSTGQQGTESLPLSVLHSAIEEKVMKGIKENMLRLQEQHRSPPPDPKQRNSSGIASWFGLKKSKLPALSRRPEAGRVKEEKRVAGGSPRTREVKGESLNISMLMEKAEDLRKALQEERAYINGLSLDKNRTCLPIEQAQNQRPLTADNFMQQLLNRVDGKEPTVEGRVEGKTPLRDFPRLSPENKESRPFRPPRNGMIAHVQRCEQKNIDQSREAVLPPDERIAESISSQHFAACDSLTRTLDSGIGTFPPPDYCGGTPNKSAPKLKPRMESPSVLPVGRFSAFPKVPRRARTLERDIRGVEEMFPPGQHQSIPAFHALLTEPEPTAGHRMYREDSSRDHSHPQQSKNWTFPNAKVSAGSAENFRSRVHELEEIPSEGDRDCDMSSYAHPSICFPGSVSSRTPSTSEVGDEGTSEAKSRDNDQGQTGLENSESLSDSLYDSLSSCGSQG